MHWHFNRLGPRAGVTRLRRAFGCGASTLDHWLCSYLDTDRAADLSALFWLLVLHERASVGRCDCPACAPSSRERFWLRADQRSGTKGPRRCSPGEQAWCLGMLQVSEASA